MRKRTMQMVWALVVAVAMLAGCRDTIEPSAASGGDTSYTREQLQELGDKADWSQDWCEMREWYSDGVCDDFCPKPDPDCRDVQCLALPTCQPGQTQIDAQACMEAGDRCGSVSMCGETVHCLKADVLCPQVVGREPFCPADTTAVEVCPEGASCMEVRGTGDKCHLTKLCQTSPDPFRCTALPTCGEGQEEVSLATCEAAADGCEEKTMCGTTIGCLHNSGICVQSIGQDPVCPTGTVAVDDCPEDASCVLAWGTRDRCSKWQVCQSSPDPISCTALPTCGEGQEEVSVATCEVAADGCEEKAMCGTTIGCLYVPFACVQSIGQPPTCPANTVPVDDCAANASCVLVWGTRDQCSKWQVCQAN